jgi:hypothetical protein
MDANNLDAGLPIKDYWVIHFDEKIRYLTDDFEDAKWALKSYSENQDLPFRMTRLEDFGYWCKTCEYIK